MTCKLTPHPSIQKATWTHISDEGNSITIHISSLHRAILELGAGEDRKHYKSKDGIFTLPSDAFSSVASAKLYVFADITESYEVPPLTDGTALPAPLDNIADREWALTMLDELLAEKRRMSERLSKLEKAVFHNSILGL